MINANELIKEMSLDDKIGQMLCFDLSGIIKNKEYGTVEEIGKRTKAGSFFTAFLSEEEIRRAKDILSEYSCVPVMVAADVEFGPGSVFKDVESLPWPMAWGACDDEELIERAHVVSSEFCRKRGIHWSFSPIVDINMNMDNPATNIRAISDSPKQVAKIGAAAVRGMQKNGIMVAGCKHFPGDGVDSRNQHFCTSVNSLSKKEWMDTFGYVYKELIREGVSSIMVGHISLPAYDEKLNDWVGYPPGSISYNLQTKLLKGELGFEGCIVSDAMSMVGVNAAVHPDKVAVEFVKAGGDMILFPNIEYFDQVKEAVLNGEISMDRIDDAVKRVLGLKEKARLFENQEDIEKELCDDYDIAELADEIANKSITLVRNYGNPLPLDIKPGDKVIMVNIQMPGIVPAISYSMDTMKEELEKRGIVVKSYVNPSRQDLNEDFDSSVAILVNIKISCRDYIGGTLRIMWEHISSLWRGSLLRHHNCIFASFGDPYKLYDYPYVQNYINVYSATPSSQRAYVRAILGEIPFEGKNPVTLEGYYTSEV